MRKSVPLTLLFDPLKITSGSLGFSHCDSRQLTEGLTPAGLFAAVMAARSLAAASTCTSSRIVINSTMRRGPPPMIGDHVTYRTAV